MEKSLVFGGSSTVLSLSYDPKQLLWRTLQRSIFEGSEQYLDRYPKSGMMRNGVLYLREEPSDFPTRETDGLRLPTPLASDFRDRGDITLPSIKRRIQIGKQVSLSTLFRGKPCPLCVEPIMGFPPEWVKI